MGSSLEANLCFGFCIPKGLEDVATRAVYQNAVDPKFASRFSLVGFGDVQKDDELPCGSILTIRESITQVIHNGVHEFGRRLPATDELLKSKWRAEIKDFCEQFGISFEEPQFLLSAHYA